MTTLVLSYHEGGTLNASTDVSRSTTKSEIKLIGINSNQTKLDKEIASESFMNCKTVTKEVTPEVVGEREVVGLEVSDLDIANRWNIKLTDDEIDLLAKIVWMESRSESNKGECGVIEVVFNRMKHWDFKGNLYEVLSREAAFSTWRLRNTAKPTKREYKNIRKVLNNKTNITTPDTVYFSTSARNNKIVIQIGNHVFCEYELRKE
jgi:spore germination cell wall hydrolase CwlJ-like protein